MSMSTSLYRLPSTKLEAFDEAGVVTDEDLAALRLESHSVDQGLGYLINDHPDVFAYILKAEGRIAHQHQEVFVGYVSPPKLKERLKLFDQLDVASVHKECGDDGLPLDYLEKNIAKMRVYLRSVADSDFALLIVQTF